MKAFQAVTNSGLRYPAQRERWRAGQAALNAVRRAWRIGLFSLCLTLLTTPAWAAIVRFPGGQSPEDRRWDFSVALLELTLAKTAVANEPDRVLRLPAQMQGRRISEMVAGRLDVAVVFASTKPVDPAVAVIPFPITRGLLGWRLLLARDEVATQMQQVTTLEALRRYKLGFSTAFSDYDLMRRAGFNIVYAGRYENLFKMLEIGRLDWLSRSISEIYFEQAMLVDRGAAGMGVLPGLALHYPADWFFAVAPHRPELKARIEKGLALALADGSYARLFDAHFGKLLRTFEAENRRVLEIGNDEFPALSPDLPADWLWKPRGAAALPRR